MLSILVFNKKNTVHWVTVLNITAPFIHICEPFVSKTQLLLNNNSLI